MNYKEAGVDLEKDSEIIHHIKSKIEGVGDFSSTTPLNVLKYIPKPFISIAVDGVGTKVMLLKDYGLSYKVAGHDLFAMNINDVICSGALPYFFADYLAYSELKIQHIKEILDGLIECCEQYGVKLVGGETAQMPDMYQPGFFDIAGMCMGFGSEDDKMIHCAQPGDYLIGIGSNGIHSNGYSLVRKVLSKMDRLPLPISDFFKPTMIYADIPHLLKDLMTGVYGMAHITGGGIKHNVERVLGGYKAELWYNWRVPEVFMTIAQYGDIEDDEMYKVFNMGIGFVLVVDELLVSDILPCLNNTSEFNADIIGRVI